VSEEVSHEVFSREADSSVFGRDIEKYFVRCTFKFLIHTHEPKEEIRRYIRYPSIVRNTFN